MKFERALIQDIAAVLVFALILALTACGKKDDNKPAENPIRISRIDRTNNGTANGNVVGNIYGNNCAYWGNCGSGYAGQVSYYGTTISVTVADDANSVAIAINLSNYVTTSDIKSAGGYQYRLQAVCATSDCTSVALLAARNPGGTWGSNVAVYGDDQTLQNGYRSRAFLFSNNGAGQLTQVRTADGTYYDLSNALPQLGVYY